MDSVFNSAREKLEREHRERKETGKLELEREKKANHAARRQREAVEASREPQGLKPLKPQRSLDSMDDFARIQQDANVDCCSDKDSKLLAYYKALLKLNEVAEDGVPVLAGNENLKRLTLNVGTEEEEEDDVCWEED